jgi:hypothetical protein
MPEQPPDSWYWEEHWNRARRGSTAIVVEWEGGRGEGVLYDEGAPRTAAGVLNLLPLSIPVVHAIWSGDMVMSTRSYKLGFADKENETRLPRVGDLSWDPHYGELAFTYGTAECRMPSGFNTVVVYGSMQSGLDEFASFCRARRFEGLGEVRISAADA